MAKLTDKQRKKIIAEYVEGGTSQRKLAEKYHVSPYLIRSILNGDKNLAQKISHKKEENTVDSLHHDARRKDFNQAIFDADEGFACFNGTDLDMVLEKFDAAVRDLTIYQKR